MSKSVRKIGTNNQLFSLEFPVTMPAVIKNPINIVKLNFKPEMRSTLVDIILKHGDEQNHSSNVKADMTDWFMHHHYAEFKQLALHAEVQSKRIECPYLDLIFSIQSDIVPLQIPS